MPPPVREPPRPTRRPLPHQLIADSMEDKLSTFENAYWHVIAPEIRDAGETMDRVFGP